MKIKYEHVNQIIDPQLLFQRLLTVRERCDDVTSLFQYELCTYTAALFESPSLLLQPNEAILADYLWKSMKEEQRNPSGDSNMSLMVVLYSIEYHGHEAPPMRV